MCCCCRQPCCREPSPTRFPPIHVGCCACARSPCARRAGWRRGKRPRCPCRESCTAAGGAGTQAGGPAGTRRCHGTALGHKGRTQRRRGGPQAEPERDRAPPRHASSRPHILSVTPRCRWLLPVSSASWPGLMTPSPTMPMSASAQHGQGRLGGGPRGSQQHGRLGPCSRGRGGWAALERRMDAPIHSDCILKITPPILLQPDRLQL